MKKCEETKTEERNEEEKSCTKETKIKWKKKGKSACCLSLHLKK